MGKRPAVKAWVLALRGVGPQAGKVAATRYPVVREQMVPDKKTSREEQAVNRVQKRRSALRHAVQIPAKITLIQYGARKPLFREMLLDLSAGGACIKTEPAAIAGANVEMEFQIPSSNTVIHARGVVMWSEATGVAGVKFAFIPPAEMAILKAWSDNAANVAASMPANLAASLTGGNKGHVRK